MCGKELFALLSEDVGVGHKFRRWTGNDRSNRHHHGVVPLREIPFHLRLMWKSGPGAKPRLVGLYHLNLNALLEAGYIRRDGTASVRLRFAHQEYGLIYIQTKAGCPRLLVGRLE